jgi:hypothetical protein
MLVRSFGGAIDPEQPAQQIGDRRRSGRFEPFLRLGVLPAAFLIVRSRSGRRLAEIAISDF